MNVSRIKKYLYYCFALLIFLVIFFGVSIYDVVAASVGDEKAFGPVGGIQAYTIPATGYYKLEVWGAQGGGSSRIGGYGAYATGAVFLRKDEKVFVVVGGAGGSRGQQGSYEGAWGTAAGGYNGGGGGYGGCGQGGGGGATHIALKTGLLSSLSSSRDDILIVASGGGGYYHWKNGPGAGNNGGGYTTTAAGNTNQNGWFGQGGSGRGNACGGGGGGGGFTGGGGGGNIGRGGGGSSYIANSKLISYGDLTKVMYCVGCATNATPDYYTLTAGASSSAVSNTAKAGAGYAKITIMDLTNTNSKLGSLSIDKGSISPAFDPDTLTYDIVVDSEAYRINVDAVAQETTSTVVGDGYVDLQAGLTVVPITVTAESGDTTVYTLNITRPMSPYKYLSDIKISGTSIPNFRPEQLSYDITVPYDMDELDAEATYGRPSQLIYMPMDLSLKTGDNTKQIIVISEDGTYTTTYTLNIKREHTSLLKELVLGDYEFEFNPTTLEYDLNILGSTMSLPVIATPYDEEATVELDGFGYIKTSQLATVTVREPNSTTTVYKVNIKKGETSVEVKYEFPYNGGTYTFTAPTLGYYKLETWGAQGGSSGGRGGYGAYAVGTIYMHEGDTIYITVGGSGGVHRDQGSSESYWVTSGGGYNGGGNGYSACGQGGGGGATHMALSSGLLSSLSNNRDDILIVAAGGGGAYHWKRGNGNGNSGGGYAPTAAGNIYRYGGFGYGGSGAGNACGGGGGGGGFTGGNGGGNVGYGGGGSSYIASSNLVSYRDIVKSMYGYYVATNSEEDNYTLSTANVSNTPISYYAKGGDGYARVTLLPEPSGNNFLLSLTLKTDNGVKAYTPNLDYEVEDYYVTLDSDETILNVAARPEDSTAKIEGLGDYDIPAGTTEIKLKVTAESGAEKIYKIHVTRPASSEKYPTDIVISGLVPSLCSIGDGSFCHLNPEKFDKNTNSYYLTVPYRIKQLYFDVHKGHPYQTVVGEGKVSLNAGENTIVIEIESEDKSGTSVYTYYVTRDMTGDTDIDLAILDPERDINFDPDISEYYTTVDNSFSKYIYVDGNASENVGKDPSELLDTSIQPLQDTVQLYIRTDDPEANFIVNGPTDLASGLNELQILVTAPSGDIRVYVLNIYRLKNENVFLSDLEVVKDSTNYTLNPTFSKVNLGPYQVTVPNEISDVDIIASPEVITTTMSGDGNKTLNVGTNHFNVTTVAENGTAEVYSLIITRQKNSNADLSSIVVSDDDNTFALVPTFDKDTLTYDVDVPEGTNKVNIVATPLVSTTTYKLLDNDVIRVGDNTKRVMAIAEDGTSKIYNINIHRPASSNNYLSDLELKWKDTEFTLNPVFDRDTLDYTLEVENEVSNVDVSVTRENNLAAVKGTGRYNLKVGTNFINVIVINEANEMRVYDVTITRKPNSNAYLSNITLGSGTLSPEFNKETLEYTLNVANEVEKLHVLGEAEVSTTKVTGNDTYALNLGENDISLVTLAEDGVTTLTYKIKVIRDKSTNNFLKDLIMEESKLSPTFSPNVTQYTAKVPYEVTKGTFHVTLQNEAATYEIIGNDNFEVGENEVIVRVTSEKDQGTEHHKDYVIKVTRQPYEAASTYLETLTVDRGTLTPEFDKTKQLYKVILPNETDKINVAATSEESTATITGTGSYNLEIGTNLIVVTVTSKDGSTRDYQIEVERKASSESRLSSLLLEGSLLYPPFNKDIFEYTTTTTNPYLSFAQISTIDPNAYFEIDGNDFSNGDGTMTITVTAPDGETQSVYNVHVTKEPSNNSNLGWLEVENYQISPEFSSQTTEYSVTIRNEVASINIIAYPEEYSATVFGDGIQIVNVGTNTFNIEVTSESGKVKTYTIIAKKEGKGNNNIADLQVLNGTMTPAFDGRDTYDVVVPYEETYLDLDVVLEDVSASYTVIGNNDLQVGNNVVTIAVTAENGSIKNYTLNVTRSESISALLENIIVKGYQLSPEFNTYINSYDILVNNETEFLDLTIIPLDKKATWVINGNENFVVGDNQVEIIVTGSRGIKVEKYYLNVRRQPYANTYMDFLYTDQGDLTPVFKRQTLEYSIDVPYDVEQIELIGEVVDKSNTVTGLGVHPLNTGENILKVVVTAASGVNRTYIITVNRSKSDDNYLASLTTRVGYTLVPNFEKTILDYTVDVPAGTTNINIQGTLSSDSASVTGFGIHNLEVGENVIDIQVTSESGKVRTYTVTVNREASSNNMLTNIIPSVGTLEPAFGYYETEYSLHLDSNVKNLGFDVITEDISALVSGKETLTVPDGDSVREIIITAEDGQTRKYTISVHKDRSDIASLDYLEVTGYPFTDVNGDPLSFDPDVHNYYISVPYNKQVLMNGEVIVTAKDPNATITKSGHLTLLTTETNTYFVTVTAPDGYTKSTYRIFIDRGKGSNALLNDLIVHRGYLTEKFNPNVFEYDWMVPKNITLTDADVTAVLQDINAQVDMTPSVTVSLTETNQFIVKVTSEDGVNTHTYVLNLIADLAGDASLGSLVVDKGYYEPTFDSQVKEYDVYEYEDTTGILVTATPSEENAVVTSGNGYVVLDNDLVEHNIVVTAENGRTETYLLRIHKSIKRDKGLKNLYLNGLENLDCNGGKCILTPNFDTDTLDYKILVPFDYTNLDILAETMNDQQTVKYKIGDNYITTYDLPVGKTQVVVEVYDGMGELTKTYTLEVERSKSSNNYLKSLEILDLPHDDVQDSYNLDPEFDKTIQEYTITVSSDVDEVVIKATPENSESIVKINGYNYLQDGNNDATITVKAPDGSERTYIIHILKISEHNSYLRNITVSSGTFADLSPKFKSTTYDYTTTINHIYDKVIVEAVPLDPTTTIVGMGEYELKTGSNIVTLIATADDGSSVSTYTINIVKSANNNVDLASLIVEEGTLSPTFDKGTTKYDITVPEDVDKLTIYAIPYERTSTVTITGNENLHSGYNTVNVIVMNKEKTVSKTYQLTVFKEKSSNNRLKDLSVFKGDDKQVLAPTFNPGKFNYRVDVTHDTEKVRIEAEAEAINAIVTGIGEESLTFGSNVRTVNVTAENGAQSSYVIDIYRNYNLDLASIVTDVGTLDPVFDKDTLTYDITVAKDIDKISIIGFAESNKVTVQGNNTYDLKAGKNTIELKVVAPDGKHKTYTINVNREADNNNYIESLVVHQGGLDPDFIKTTEEYTVNVRKTTTKLDLDIVLESDKAKYQVLGNENFKMGYNEVIIRVTAENGDVRDYTLNVVLREDDYFSNRLLDLSISEGKLNPDFDPDTYYYAAYLPNSTSSVIISATKESDKSTVTGTGLVNLEVGRNIFPVKVTGKDGRTTIYTLVIYRNDTNDATLSTLSVKGYSITPIFNKQQEDYRVTINKGETTLDLTALPTDKNATVKILGNENLAQGENTISIFVTAPDGVTTKTYTLTVQKEYSTNNFLSSLEVNGYTFTPEFIKTNNGPYTLEVNADVNSIVIEATPEVPTTTISGDGARTLDSNNNVFEVTATSEAGDKRVYTIIVKKKLDGDNTLKQLVVSDGELTPSFSPTITDYTVTVPRELEEITVIGFANKATSTVVGNGSYKLTNNPTMIPIIVTAEDGTNKTYTIAVEKEVENSSKIIDLIVKNGELKPHFNKNIESYTVAVPNEVTKLDMIVTLEDDKATYVVKGNDNFKVGNNKVQIVVTGTDGGETTYEINVIRGVVSSNYLSYLRVDGYQIDPSFDKETLYYTLTVPNDVTEANIIASLEDASSTLTGDGIHSLEVGRNDCYVTVTSYSGVIRTYTVAITRESEFSSKLMNLVVKNGELKPEFNKNKTDYKVSVPNEVTALDIEVTLEDENATYKIIGNENFNVGDNLVKVIVTSKDGYKTTYNITVTREILARNYLATLEVEGYQINPEFNKAKLDYTLTVPNNVDKVTIKATTEDTDSTITGVGEVTLNVGDNPKYVTVTSNDGIVRTYTITITKEKAENAKIMDLIVKDGELKPKFNKDVNEYGVIVPYEVTKLDMIITLEDDYSTYEVKGNENFVIGNNRVEVIVTSKTGNTNTYVINVTRGTYANNFLSDLKVENQTISPTFDKETLYYTLTVPNSVSSANIIATLEDSSSTVTGTGVKNLEVGRNDCYVTVTSSNGVVRTYTIAITRESEFSSKLRDLIVKNGELKPHFDKDVTDYKISVPYEVTKLDMIITLEDNDATYKVVGNENFKVGSSNFVKVIVTSKDGYDTTYKIQVTRGTEAQNYLTNLEVENFTMSPTFDKETLYYTLTVPKETNQVNIIATLEDPASSVTGNGIKTLVDGRNDCYVTVKSSDGIIRTYTISITKETENDNKLLTLVSDIGTINPTFEPTINEYTLKIPTNASEVNLTGTVSQGATATGLGKVIVTSDKQDHNIIVTGGNGNVNTYVIHIEKGDTTSTELLKLIPSVGTMNYSNDITDYAFEVQDNASTISFDYELSDPTATITGVELRNLEYGENNIQIVVTAKNGDTRTINVKVTRNKDLIAIIPDEENMVLIPEEEKTVTYTFDPTDTTYTDVEFSIGDTDVAEVDENGKVTAKTFGSTILTIKSKHNPLIFAQVTIDVLNTKITSSILDVIRDVPEDECSYDSCPNIVIGEEPDVALSDFITKFDNEETNLHIYDKDDNEIEDMTTFTGSFMKLKLIIRDKIYDELIVVVRGDFDGDGIISSNDSVGVINLILLNIEESYLYLKIADVDQDEIISSNDSVAVINFILYNLTSLNNIN